MKTLDLSRSHYDWQRFIGWIKDFDTIVAVRHPYSDEDDRRNMVVSPCGISRELISDFGPACFVILEMDEELVTVKIEELILLKYTRS
ncbi:hypothetical protein MH122_15940 [Bacillus pumilus]|nr:hypothetical protein [Bacillus pumilus]MCY7680288.1 hypothetical protein [Bacillus pumilus]MCY9674439.1 hypothetical protein [Bacillus pumilus]MDH3151556.1 hypothetical protein [Bacillus pumilus]